MAVPQRVRIAEQLMRRLEWDDLDRAAIRRLAECARDEEFRGYGLQEQSPKKADGPPAHFKTRASGQLTVDLIASADLVVCGSPIAPMVLTAFGVKGAARLRVGDGTLVPAGTVIATLAGSAAVLAPAASALQAFFRRLSGIATRTRRHVDALGKGRTRLLDSGATTPGWRMLEKYAIGCGGAWNGGAGSFDRIHLEARSRETVDLAAAIRRARESIPDVPVVVTVRDSSMIEETVAAAPDLIRLDRFSVAQLRRAVACVNGRVFVEAHGGIVLASLRRHAGLGLDFVSVDGLVSDAGWAHVDAVWHD